MPNNINGTVKRNTQLGVFTRRPFSSHVILQGRKLEWWDEAMLLCSRLQFHHYASIQLLSYDIVPHHKTVTSARKRLKATISCYLMEAYRLSNVLVYHPDFDYQVFVAVELSLDRPNSEENGRHMNKVSWKIMNRTQRHSVSEINRNTLLFIFSPTQHLLSYVF